MENASKALIMAASVLIGVVMLSLLVIFFQNLRSLKAEEQTSVIIEQTAEFNKQFEAYNRIIYGSELLSIVNKIEDYNHRESEVDGYKKMEIYITFNEVIKNSLKDAFKDKNEILSSINQESYDSKSIRTIKDEIDKQLNTTGLDKTIANSAFKFYNGTDNTTQRKIYQLATMRSKDIENLGKLQNDEEQTRLDETLRKYKILKDLSTQIKQIRFKCIKFEYDTGNGRITNMHYEQI